MIVAIAGGKGSPGVTTVAYGLARLWRGRTSTLLLEADPGGGSLAARLGIAQEPGLGTLAAAGRHELSEATLVGHAQGGPARLALVVAPSAPSHARAALLTVAEAISQSLARLTNTTVVVDLGRLDGESPSLSLARAASRFVFLTQPTLEGADALAVRLAELADLRPRAQMVTVGDGAYGGDELGRVLSVSHAGHIPNDPAGAHALWSAMDSGRLPGRPLLRALQTLAGRLEPDPAEPTPPPEFPGVPARHQVAPSAAAPGA